MFRYSFVFSLLFLFKPVLAVEVLDLYSAKVELISQTQQDKNKAFKAAMKTVLIKIAGNDDVILNAFIKSEIQKHSTYLTQFNYVTENNKNKLVASFDENKINNLFFQQNIPLWGSLRPLVLFWIASENGLNRHVVSETENSSLYTEISTMAQARGLPIVLPLMDLTDTQNIHVSDLWGRFIGPIKLASQRYNPESVVVIRISENVLGSSETESSLECDLVCTQSPITLDWHIVTAESNKVESGKQYKGVDELLLIKSAMSDITANIAQRYALTANNNHDLIIDVANIDSLSKYVEVSRFLEKTSAISSVKLIRVEGNNRRFQLTLMGSPETLFASLKLNNKLKQYVGPVTSESIDEIPVFLWGTE